MEFKTDPFYLYPVTESLMGKLFIDRDEEIKIAKGILKTRYKNKFEICTVIGGIGVGKSSMLNYLSKLAESMNYKVKFFNNADEFFSDKNALKNGDMVFLIDDVDKLNDDDAGKFYNSIEKSFSKSGGIVYFSDIYNRSKKTLNLRNFIVSQNISLPKKLSKEKLKFFLEERMKNCIGKDKKFTFPFDNESLEMAAIRSGGNLRNFLSYTKNAYLSAIGSKRKYINAGDMKEGMIIIDRTFLGNCDLIDFKILWYATTGEMNKTYLAHQCDIDTKTLDSRIEERLDELIVQKRSGREVIISSIYKEIEEGKDILERVMEGLGLGIKDI